MSLGPSVTSCGNLVFLKIKLSQKNKKDTRCILTLNLVRQIPTYNDKINATLTSRYYNGEPTQIRDHDVRAEEPIIQTFEHLADGKLPLVTGLSCK